MEGKQNEFEVVIHTKNKPSNWIITVNAISLGICALGIATRTFQNQPIEEFLTYTFLGISNVSSIVYNILRKTKDTSKTQENQGGKSR